MRTEAHSVKTFLVCLTWFRLEFDGMRAANSVDWQGELPHAGFDDLA